MEQTRDVHIIESRPLPSPDEIISALPLTDKVTETVLEGRLAIKKMLRNQYPRLLIIVGPCSIHDEKAAYDYAERLKRLQDEVKDHLYLVMRVYFEKPRTVIGWKGLINDPFLDESSDIAHGLRKGREILLNINDIGLPAATELLDPVIPQYISDLICWAAIGARTTESQIHREMASGLSMPVGFKNSTEGNLQIAIDAIQSARFSHSFLGINRDGKMYIWKSAGNIWGHIILRGGRADTNYDYDSIQDAVKKLTKAKLPPFVMVDCSHANSNKIYQKQVDVFKDLIQQKKNGNDAIRGLMLESHINEGSQNIPKDLSQLKYGVSITDPCLGWEKTKELLLEACHELSK